MAIDIETATLFSVGFYNKTLIGAMFLISGRLMIAEGVKTERSDKIVSKNFVENHLEIGIASLKERINNGFTAKYLRFDY